MAKTILTTYKVNKAIRKSKCICCGCVIESGEERYQLFTPKHKGGQSAHTDCVRKMWADGIAETLFHENNYNSKSCVNHSIMIIAPKEEFAYFGECGFSINPYSPTHRKYTLDLEVNGYRSGHVVSEVFKKTPYKVFVNGVEVKSHEEYKRVLGK